MATLKLKNIRNSCYANAVIQFLYSIPKFKTFIAEKLYDFPLKTGRQQVCEYLHKLFSQPQQVQDVEDLQSSIERSFPQHSEYNTNAMQDCTEFMIHFLEWIDSESRNLCDESTLGLFRGIQRHTKRFTQRGHNSQCKEEAHKDEAF